MPRNYLNFCETDVHDYPEGFQKHALQLFGNGTTALYAALKAVNCSGRYVAISPTTCPTAITAIYASSNLPYFVDIELDRFGLDPEKLESVLSEVGAVIAIHAYGIPCKIDKIKQLCNDYSVSLIEDCAQAEGATYEGQPVGCFGDTAVFSYGSGKIISAGGGGASITRDRELALRIKKVHDELPSGKNTRVHHELGTYYKSIYNQYYPDNLASQKSFFTQHIREAGLDVLLPHNPAYDEAISEGWQSLSSNIQSRREKSKIYRSLLADNEHIKILDFPSGAVPWRFNLHLDHTLRQRVLRKMLDMKLNVSSWYPDISQFIDNKLFSSTSLENSHWLERGILNFWLDETTSINDIHYVSRTLVSEIKLLRNLN